jgi:hypothetical protein
VTGPAPAGVDFIRLRLSVAILRGDDATAVRLWSLLDKLLNGELAK